MSLAALLAKTEALPPTPFTEVRQPNKDVIAHIDGDYAAYFCAGGDDLDPGDARKNVVTRCERLKYLTGASSVVMHLTHGASTKGDRFLAACSIPYQGQRVTGRKPRNWQFLREYMEEYDGPTFTPKIWTTREADDGVALVTNVVAEHKNVLHVVHTRDKDFRMFCGTHVSWLDFLITDVPLGTFELIGADGKLYGHKWFWNQMLQGDTADNIPGLHKVGEKTAEAWLEGVKDNREACMVVAGKYREKKGDAWADYFAEQAVLLWMRTDRDASLLNVLTLGCFGDTLTDAFTRLAERVAQKKAEVQSWQG